MACHFVPPTDLWLARQHRKQHRSREGTLEGQLIRLVLIEDDDLMREWLGRSLSSRGYTVTRYARAEHALPAVSADPPDVVVTDIRMPGMSGLELGRRLRTRGIEIPIVFMTADPSEHLDVEALAVGSGTILRKPFSDVADLWNAVDDAVARAAAGAQSEVTENSHALRTPLTAVRMAVEGLIATRELDAREQHLADIATRNLDRLTDAVESCLARLALVTDRRASAD
jgi:DNA-binding response OmpR family regulator